MSKDVAVMRAKNSKRIIRFAGKEFSLPDSLLLRLILGVALIFGGVLGFLPIVGFWMIPLGLLVLSVDFAPVRRFRRVSGTWLVRQWRYWFSRKVD
jgi:hypothetical protein